MSKMLVININGVVLSVSAKASYVCKNQHTGIRYLTGSKKDAVGVMADGKVYNLIDAVLVGNFNDAASVVSVPDSDIPSDIGTVAYTWTQSGGFAKYDGVVPLANEGLTKKANITSANVDYLAMMSGITL